MASGSPDKARIRAELLKCAKARPMEILFYSDFAPRVGMSPQGPWKKVLDEISREETEQGRSDITFLLRKKSTGYPGQIGFRSVQIPDSQQKAKARAELQKIIDEYSPGTSNPY
jgi:hypothetical protein